MAHLKWIFFGICLFTLVFLTWYKHKVKKGAQEPKERPWKFPGILHFPISPRLGETRSRAFVATDGPRLPAERMYFYEYEPAYKQNFSFILRERLKCEDSDIFLVILVPSRPADTKGRQTIRLTWGSNRFWWGNQVLILFLLGQDKERDDNSSLAIKEESILYGDIIQLDILDTYNNLTLKTIMAFRWVTEFCSNARYVMKADTDTFINTGNLVKYLVNSKTSENFITGYPLVEARCIRDLRSHLYISHDEYPFEIFPPYLGGLGYVLDTRLARRIYETMAHVKPIRFEDVYVGICLSILGVGITFPRHNELFFIERTSFDICKFKHLIAAHRIPQQEIVVFWNEIRESSVRC